MNKYSKTQIGALKRRVNLVDIIGKSVDLNAGSGLCPFHAETTPSFTVNQYRYHCFGCGAHGDVFSWLTEHEGLSFAEAVRRIDPEGSPAVRGEVLKEEPRPPYSPVEFLQPCERERLLELNDAAHLGFQAQSQGTDVLGRFTKQEILDWGLGYAALEPWDLSAISFPDAVALGLSAQDSRGRYYPRYRDRIIIPMWDVHGAILGFLGRAAGKGQPKYLCPPDTKLFKKSRYIWGLRNQVGREGPLWLVEGAADAIAMCTKGYQAIALLGCQMSREQCNILLELGSKRPLIVCMDGDAPGLDAGPVIWHRLREAGLVTSLAIVPEGLDPFEWARGEFAQMHIARPSNLLSHELILRMAKQWDRSALDKLAEPYVRDNERAGYHQYNVIAWVCAAWPQYADEIRAAYKAMIANPISQGDLRAVDPERAKAFLRAWIRPCKEVRLRDKNK